MEETLAALRARLREGPLEGCDLSNTNFEGTSLKGFWFERCRMRGIKLAGCKLDTIFKKCDLRGVDFRAVKISDASFEKCDLTGALFAGLNAKNCFFGGTVDKADFTGATIEGCLFERCRGARFVNAKAGGAIFEGSATGADFSGADLRSASLKGARLAGATFNGARYNRKTDFPRGFRPAREGMVLEKQRRPAREAPALGRDAFLAKYGAPVRLAAPTARLAQVTLGQLSRKGKQGPVFSGAFTTTGYFRSAIDPARAKVDFAQHALDLEIVKELAASLKGAHEQSAFDCPYHAFVLPAAPDFEAVDFLTAMGLSGAWRDGGTWINEANMTGEANVFVARDRNRRWRVDGKTLAAFRKATKVMKKRLTDLQLITFYKLRSMVVPPAECFPTHPIFVIGRSSSGALIGAFAIRQD